MAEGMESTASTLNPVLPTSEKITFGGLTKATVETILLAREHQVNFLSAPILIAMKAAFPEEFTPDKLKHSSRLPFFTSFSWAAVQLNDAVDLIPYARRTGNQEVVENIFSSWKKSLRATRSIRYYAGESPDPHREELLENCQREVLCVERSAREQGQSWDLARTIQYRELMNAISVVHSAATLLGYDALVPHLQTISKQDLTIDALEQKYSWLINNNYQTIMEQKLGMLYNMIMGMQAVDDWLDREEDMKLGLHTVATKALHDTHGNQNVAQSQVKHIADNYFSTAEHIGVTHAARWGMKTFFTGAKKFLNRIPKFVVPHHGFRQREVADIMDALSTIDVQPHSSSQS